jgi:hypothetical protein
MDDRTEAEMNELLVEASPVVLGLGRGGTSQCKSAEKGSTTLMIV